MRRVCLISILLLTFFMGNVLSPAQAAFAPWSSQRRVFVEKILTAVETVNQQVRLQRLQLSKLYRRLRWHALSKQQRQWLQQLVAVYQLKNFDINQRESWQALFERVDVVPPSLAIAQAVTESAWGNSRFAREGNNFYGTWCYQPGCGLVPKQRAEGKTFEVRAYPDALASVRGYVYNLNRNKAYLELRQLRAERRQQGALLTGKYLAQGLEHYSARGEDYVRSLRAVINHYNLTIYDRLKFNKVS